MPSVTVEGILIGVVITLLGVVVGGYLGYHFSRKVAEEQMRLMAGAKLRGVFARGTSEYTLMGRKLGYSLGGELLSHAAAIEEYMVFVPKNRRGEYKKAWECYYKPLTERAGLTGPYEDSKICMERIEGILKFTEPF